MASLPTAHAKGRVALVLFLAASVALAGCIASSSPAPGTAGSLAPNEATRGAAAPATDPLLHNVTINVAIIILGVQGPGGGIDAPTCGAGATDCSVGGHEEIVFPDATVFNGTLVDYLRSADSVRQQAGAGVMVFTGSIVGCTGAGTATLPWTGDLDPNPIALDASGEILHAHDDLTTPTNSTGFARISDLRLHADYFVSPVGITGHGVLTGYILCQ